MRVSALVVFFALILCFIASIKAQEPNPAPPDKKQLETEAKNLVAEGKALEDQGKLADALNKYIDAEGVLSTSDALDGIKRIHDEQNKQVSKLIEDAQASFSKGQFADAVQHLQDAEKISPTNGAVQYDLGLCYWSARDRTQSLTHLDEAVSYISNRDERMAVLEARSAILAGASIASFSPDLVGKLEGFNALYLKSSRDPGEPNTENGNGDSQAGSTLCQQTITLQSPATPDPAAVFNLGKCAEEDARPGDAAQQLDNYLQLAPDALDHEETTANRAELTSLAALDGAPGASVRQHFATAARYLDYRRFDRATSEYQEAEKELPTYAPTEWRLALLYEAYGDVANARAHFSLFQQLESDPAFKARAQTHLDSLDNRRAVYDANVEDAQDILTALMLNAMGLSNEGVKHRTKMTRAEKKHASSQYKKTLSASEKLSTPYVQRGLQEALEDLRSATLLFPLGVEANELLALIDLEENDWPSAYRSFDAPASQNLPVSFYAQVFSSRESNVVRATKVEIGKETVRLVYLSSYDAKKKVEEAPDVSAGDDDLGNLVVSASEPPDPDAEALVVKAEEIKGIQTDRNFVVLKLEKEQLYLAPVYMLGDAPFEGRASRYFGNEYTRMFIRYLGYEDAKLGTEGMTAGEKFHMGYEIAQLGLVYFSMVNSFGAGSFAAYSSTARVAQLMHALSVFHTVMSGVHAAHTATETAKVVNDLRIDMASLQQITNDLDQAVFGLEFKVIPTHPVELPYREKL